MKLVSIQITPSHISCALIEGTTTQQLRVRAYETTPFTNLECEKLVIFNQPRLRAIIGNFIRTHNMQNAYATCALTGPNIFEGMISQPTPHPKPEDFSLARSKHHVWDYQFLYPHENGSSMFYVCGIPHTLLFQYRLLAQSLDLRIARITTRRMALLHAYEHVQGAAYRPAQLAVDMMQHNNMIEELFTRDLFHRLIYADPALASASPQAIPDMLTASGLYVAEYPSLLRSSSFEGQAGRTD